MSGVSAHDPSSWADGESDPLADVQAEYVDLTPEPLIDRAALEAEYADLQNLITSARAQFRKAEATATAAKAELARLEIRARTMSADLDPADEEEDG